jgi:hypothetical protein
MVFVEAALEVAALADRDGKGTSNVAALEELT